MFGQNCENTTTKKPETRSKVDFLFERHNVSSEKPARKICSSSVMDHRDSRNIRPQIIWPTANFRPQIAHLGPRNFRPEIISPTLSKHISTPVPKVKELSPVVSISS